MDIFVFSIVLFSLFNIFFWKKKGINKINTIHCEFNVNYLCDTSQDIRSLIKIMNQNTIPMSITILNQLMKHLYQANKIKQAQNIYTLDFSNYNLKPNSKTEEIRQKYEKKTTGKKNNIPLKVSMENKDKKKPQQHQKTQKNIIMDMYYNEKKNKKKTMKYLNQLIMKGEATTSNCVWGMQQLCNTTNALGIMQLMKENGIEYDTHVLNVLIEKYVKDQKYVAANNVFKKDFVKYGLVPNEKTMQLLELDTKR